MRGGRVRRNVEICGDLILVADGVGRSKSSLFFTHDPWEDYK